MKKKGMELIFLVTVISFVFFSVGCVKKKTDNTTATVETPTPTETPEAAPTPTETPKPTVTPSVPETIVNPVEVENEDSDAYDSDEWDTDNGYDNNGSGTSGNGGGNAEPVDKTHIFADDYTDDLPDDQVGYASGSVSVPSDPASPGEGNQAIIAADVYVRSGPGTTYEIIGMLKEGKTVVILGNENGWLKINYGTKTGYFYKDYVVKE